MQRSGKITGLNTRETIENYFRENMARFLISPESYGVRRFLIPFDDTKEVFYGDPSKARTSYTFTVAA